MTAHNPTLTRFDFHVFKFMHSPDVQTMSRIERGDYFWLICQSWAIGNNCLLPTDEKRLARLVGVQPGEPDISPLVLEKFPVENIDGVEYRRNKVLHKEWLAALKRSNDGRKYGRKRWRKEKEAT